MRFDETLPRAITRHHPGVAVLLRPGALAQRIQDEGLLPAAGATPRVLEAEPFYLRLKTEGCVLIQFRVRLEGEGAEGEHIAYARVSDPARSRELAAKWATLHPASEGPLLPLLLLEDAGAVLFSFPNDMRLRGLKTCGRPDKLKRLLDEAVPRALPEGVHAGGRKAWVHALRWKPERRFVFRYEFPLRRDDTGKRVAWKAWIGRLYADGAGERTRAALEALGRKRTASLARGAGGLEPPRLPALEVSLPRHRMLFQTALAGRTLFTAVREDGIPQVRQAVRAAARAVAWMHAAPQVVPPPPAVGPPAATDPALEATARDWETLEPDLAEPAWDVARGYRPSPLARPAWIHGDLYAQQILIDPQGAAGLLDFDEAGAGDRHRDVGNVIAHAAAAVQEGALSRERGEALVQGFLESYGEAAEGIDEARLRAECARSLALLSFAALRSLHPLWRKIARSRLEHAARIASGGDLLAPAEGAA